MRRRITSTWLILGLLSTTMISSAGYTTPAQEILDLPLQAVSVQAPSLADADALQDAPEPLDQVTVGVSVQIVDRGEATEYIHQDEIELFEELSTPEIESYILDESDQDYADEYAESLEDFLFGDW